MPLPPLSFAFARPPATWLALLLAAPCAAVAGTSAPAPVSSTLARQDVALLAGTCANCHGPDGRAPQGSTIPSLRGQRAQHLQQHMSDFKAGTAPDATVMARLMKGYDSAQIEALARWFANAPGQEQQ